MWFRVIAGTRAAAATTGDLLSEAFASVPRSIRGDVAEPILLGSLHY